MDEPSPLERREAWLKDYRPDVRVQEQGTVVSVGDGIVWIRGLPTAAMDDVLFFEDGSRAVVFDLTRELVGGVLLVQTQALTAGTVVYHADRRLSISVSEELIGRVIDPLGRPLDGAGPVRAATRQYLDVLSPPILMRDFVRDPLYTGIKIIDTMIPIGKGQRQLIIGDEGLGRSSLAIDVVVNQRGKNVNCIYVLVGQKRSTVIDTVNTLRDYGALEYTTVVVGEASALPGLKYLAPFAGCAVAEGWMSGGRDTLVVYDDLGAHAQAYRELSLLMRRPPGREAYPGDIFYLHARLLERATCLAAGYGGGSMTALPIVGTKEGDIAAYIPTNLISITDGQIYLDHELFVAGFRPAIDIAKSVSRIGGKAQHPRIKDEAARMKLDYLQFLELEVFTRFGAKLDPAMEHKIKRGQMLREILKQDRLAPLPASFHVAWLIAFNEGLFDQAELEDVASLLDRLRERVLASPMSLDQSRDKWVEEVRRWVAAEGESGP